MACADFELANAYDMSADQDRDRPNQAPLVPASRDLSSPVPAGLSIHEKRATARWLRKMGNLKNNAADELGAMQED